MTFSNRSVLPQQYGSGRKYKQTVSSAHVYFLLVCTTPVPFIAIHYTAKHLKLHDFKCQQSTHNQGFCIRTIVQKVQIHNITILGRLVTLARTLLGRGRESKKAARFRENTLDLFKRASEYSCILKILIPHFVTSL